jgi:hypothetical protein
VRDQRLVVVALSAVVLVIGGAALLAPGGSAAPSAFPGGPYFIVACGFSHHSNDDPIVFPEQPGRSHSHTFIGNRSTAAASTPVSLQAAATNCELPDDASAYWFPTLFENRVAVRPLAALVYYVRRTSVPVRAFPPRLKMIAGNSEARRPQALHIASWGCGAVDGGGRRFHSIPRCSKDNFLNLRSNFRPAGMAAASTAPTTSGTWRTRRTVAAPERIRWRFRPSRSWCSMGPRARTPCCRPAHFPCTPTSSTRGIRTCSSA